MKLQSFTGFRGKAALVAIGDVQFMIVARNIEQLEIIYAGVMTKAAPFNPAATQSVILISNKTLPEAPAAPGGKAKS